MKTLRIAILVLLAVAAVGAGKVKIEKGWLSLDIVTGDSHQEHKVEYSGQLKQTLTLTQSSKINIKAKITFSSQGFQPQLISFRLRHPTHNNITEPVLAIWDADSSSFQAVVDLGDPKQISHMSGFYKLEIIIGDDRLETNVRRNFATCNVTFRYSLQHPQPHQLDYILPSTIMTQPPAERVDPPALFTGFVCVVLVLLFGIFLKGLAHQQVNFNLFPSDGTGSILNLIFLGCLGLVLFMLLRFYISWTFITTVNYFLLAMLPIAFAANYAFVHIKRS